MVDLDGLLNLPFPHMIFAQHHVGHPYMSASMHVCVCACIYVFHSMSLRNSQMVDLDGLPDLPFVHENFVQHHIVHGCIHACMHVCVHACMFYTACPYVTA